MSIKREIREASRTETQDGKSYRSCWSLSGNGREFLSVEESAAGKTVTFRVTGNIVFDAAPLISYELQALATTDCDVTFDCAGLTAISNSCMDGLIKTQQIMDSLGKGTLRIINMPDAIREDFRKSGAEGVLDVE